jgi:hypothetical protein
VVWVLVCALVLLFGGAYLFLQAREVWRKSVLLLGEIEEATARAEAASRPASATDPAGGT